MKVIVFDKNTSKGNFNNYGYGKITKIRSCIITEEINSRYELELIVDLEDSKIKYLTKWAIIMAKGQLFRIINTVKDDTNNTLKILANHIFYDIDYGFTVDERAENCDVAKALRIAVPSDFRDIYDVSSDIEDKSTLYFVKNNGVESVLGIIDRWGQGELVRDNFNIAVNKSKGVDKGVTFTYNKIKGLEITEDTTEVVTRLYPTGKDGISLEEKYIIVPNWSDVEYPPFHITREVNFSGVDSEGELREVARAEAEKIGIASTNIKVDIHDLIQTDMYKDMPNLLTTEVGDIVTIKHAKLDVRVKVKVIKKVENLVTGEVTIELGQPLKTFFEGVGGTGSIELPNLDRYEDTLFYYSNGVSVDLDDFQNGYRLGHITYGVTDTTNLLMYFNAYFEVMRECDMKIIIKIDNTALEFQPIIHLENGYRSINFTYPLLNTAGGVAHTMAIYGVLSEGGRVMLRKEHEHIIVRGQNVSASLSQEPPHAEVEERFEIPTTANDRSGVIDKVVGDVVISKLIPHVNTLTEQYNLSRDLRVFGQEAHTCNSVEILINGEIPETPTHPH